MTHTIESERAKYDAQYLGTHPDGHFTKHHGGPLVEWFDWYAFDSVLDIGTGAGAWWRVVDEKAWDQDCCGTYHGAAVDISPHAFGLIHPSMPVCKIVAPAHQIPLVGKFDLVTACDLLEHLPRQWVRPTLEEIKRLAGYQVGLTIASHEWGDLHLTVEPREWWVEQIRAVFGDVETQGDGEVYYLEMSK